MAEKWNNFENLNIDNLVKNPECSVNDKGFFRNSSKIKLFRCIKCNDSEDSIICESCTKKCHIGHKFFEETGKASNHICDCAKNGHKISSTKFSNITFKECFTSMKNELKKNSQKFRMNCPFFEIIRQLKCSYRHSIDGKIVCPICKLFCLNHIKSFSYEKINEEDSEECNCDEFSLNECHQPTQNLDLLKSFLISNEANYLLPVRKLIYAFLTSNKCYKYWEIISIYNNSINIAIKNGNYIKFQEEENILYTKSLNLLNIIGKTLRTEYIEIINENFNFENQFKFLNELFSTNERQKDLFCLYKLYNLKIFRKFFILPRLKHLFFMTIKSDSNTNTFHRLMLQPHLDQLLSDIKLKSEQLFTFLNKIYYSIINYFSKFNEDDINGLIKEYLRYVRLLLNYKVEKEIINNIVNHLNKICELTYAKNDEFRFLRQLEPIVYLIMLQNNDCKILDGLKGFNSDEKEKQNKKEYKFAFEYNDINEKLAKILFLSSLDKLDLNIIDNSDPKLIKKFYVSKTSLFDNLVNESDFFSQSIHSFLESNLRLFNQSEFLYFVNSHDFKMFSKYIPLNLINNLLECIKNIELLKIQYYAVELDENMFFNKIKDILDIIYELINKEIYKIDNSIETNFFKQIVLYKIGLYHTLVSIVRTFKNDFWLQDYLINSNMSEIFYKNVLRLLDIISHDNPFLISLNFNKNIINLFFNFPETKNKEVNKSLIDDLYLDFFINQIKVLKKFQYKIECRVLIDKIIPEIFRFDKKCLKITKILKIFYYSLLQNNVKTSDILTDHICSALRSLLNSTFFPKFLLEIRKDNLAKGKIILEYIDETERVLDNYHKVVSNLCRILNHLKTQYFFFLTKNIKPNKKPDVKNNILMKKISDLFNQEISSYSIIDIVELYVKKVRNQSPKYLNKYLLTFYKKNFENCKVIKTGNYEDLPIFEREQLNAFRNLKGFEDEIEIETENNLFREDHELAKKKDEEIKMKIKIKLMEREKSLGIFKKYLKNFPKILKKHYTLFTSDAGLLLEYFENVIIYPVLHIVHQYIVNKMTTNINVICEISSINIMFLENYKILLTILKSLYQGENKYRYCKKIQEFYNNTDNIENFMERKLSFINEKILEMKNVEFEHFNVRKILQIFSNSLENIVFFEKIVKSNYKKNNSQSLLIQNSFYSNLLNIINHYDDLKKNFDNENILIYNIFTKNDSVTRRIKSSICLNLMVKFEETEIFSLTPYTEKNLIIIELLDKVFKADPNYLQEFLSSFKYSIDIFKNIIQKQLVYLTQPVIIESLSLYCNKNHSHYKYFLYLLEFLRLTCENHNAYYQTLLFNFPILKRKNLDDINFQEKVKSEFYYLLRKNERSTFLNFIVNFFVNCINNNMLFFVDGEQNLLRYFTTEKFDYYYQMIEKFTDLIIEMIQGTFPFNLKKLSVNSSVFSKYFNSMVHNFNLITLGEEIEYLLSNFMRFLKAYMEDSIIPTENKKVIIKKINPKKLYDCFLYIVKKLYVKFINSSNNLNYHNVKIPRGGGKLLENLYLTNKNFSEDPLFILSSQIYYFITVSCIIDSSNNDYLKIIHDLKELYLKIDEIKSSELVSNAEIFSFYNKIVKTVEISYITNKLDKNEVKKYDKLFRFIDNHKNIVKDINQLSENNSESKLINVVFIVNPITMFLNNIDMLKFFENAPYETFNEKLSYILEYIPTFLDLINLRQELFNYSKALFYLYSIDYNKTRNYSVLISLIINILLFFTLFLGDSQEIESSSESVERIVFSISFLHILSNLFYIINYVGFNIYRLNTYTFKRNENISFLEKLTESIKIILENDLLPIVWNFIFGLMAILSENTRWMYSLQLFSAFMIFPTMSIIITSIKVRYNQFFSTALLMIIVLMFYSSISFYFFRDLYFDSDLNENLCSSLFYCFLNMINNGLRSQTIGDFSNFKSIKDKYYLVHFIFQWIFFFVVILLLLNIVNGIIVDTFQELREENNKNLDDKENVCYICNLNRSVFEIAGINFQKHRNEEHFLNNYIYYLLKLNLSNEYNLNSLESYVLNAIKENRMDFFPIETSISMINSK